MKVVTLVTIPRLALFRTNTLFLDTLTVGWPDTEVEVYDNANAEEITAALAGKISECAPNATLGILPKRMHHAKWIERMIESHDGELMIADPDVIYWSSCEPFHYDSLLAGHYIPTVWNEFAKCVSVDRLHTAMLYIRDCAELRDTVKRLFPQSHMDMGDYCPCDPYMPAVRYLTGRPYFWDSCAGLYQMIGGKAYEPYHLDCYSHVNCGSFFDLMVQRVENQQAFQFQHRMALENPEWLRGFWRAEDAYYADMHQRALDLYSTPPTTDGGL